MPSYRLMGWDSELRSEIRRNFKVGQRFTLNDIYELETYFVGLYPNNAHVRDKLRQILQHLRDEGVVEFIDDQGNYRRLK
ncbi:MAG: hypothetical protein ABSA52_24005 [Candidatus Binatia bacterium]